MNHVSKGGINEDHTQKPLNAYGDCTDSWNITSLSLLVCQYLVVVSNATSDIARSIGYELRIVMNITNTSTNELDINDMNSLSDFVNSFQLGKVTKVKELLESKEFIDSVRISIPLSISVKLDNSYENLNILFLGIDNKHLLSKIKENNYCLAVFEFPKHLKKDFIKLHECDRNVRNFIRDSVDVLLKGWTRYEIVRFGPFTTRRAISVLSFPLLFDSQIVVLVPYNNLPSIVMEVVDGLELSPPFIAYGIATLLVNVSESSYLNPLSVSSSIDKIIEMTHSIEEYLSDYGVTVANGEVVDKLDKITAFENISRAALVMGMIPALIMLIIVSRSIMESTVLSMRRYIALAKLRGISPRKFSLWVTYSAILWVVVGIGVAYLCTALISRLLVAENWNLLLSLIFTDPIIVGGTIALSLIIVIIIIRKCSVTISKLPPAEAIKTTLAPEELLGREKIGVGTLILLVLGLYHVGTGLLRFSASTYLVEHGAELIQNFVLLILLIILAMIEGFTRPFAPAFYAYSIAKILSAKSDKILKALSKVVSALSGKLEVAVRGLILVKRRRLGSILMLSIFSLSILIGSYLGATALNTIIDSATTISIGSEYHALWLLDLVGLRDKAERYPEELSGDEQQRVAIAIALANDPPIILADEPTAELDSLNAKMVIDLLLKLARNAGKTIILATHDPRIAIKTDRILRLEDGLIVGEYTPLDLERTSLTLGVIEGTTQISIAEVIKMRIAKIEKELTELESKYKEGVITLEELTKKVFELKKLKEALEDLLISVGGQ